MDRKTDRRRGIFLLPNLLTTGGLFAGFYAIVAAMAGHYQDAAVAVFVAMVMDGLDGRVARLTNTESDFGVEYDSLSDMVSFGLAPALVVYQWSLVGLGDFGWLWGKLGWLAAFVYAAGAALRLARFNTQAEHADKTYFQGLPSPSAAAVMAGFVWTGADAGIDGTSLVYAALLLTPLLGVLMVSNVRYYSFKKLGLKDRIPFIAVFVIVLGFVLAALDPAKVLFAVFFGYVVSGPVMTFLSLRRARRMRRAHGARHETGAPPDEHDR